MQRFAAAAHFGASASNTHFAIPVASTLTAWSGSELAAGPVMRPGLALRPIHDDMEWYAVFGGVRGEGGPARVLTSVALRSLALTEDCTAVDGAAGVYRSRCAASSS